MLEDPDALTMVFQPVLDLRTGRVAAYEALARFNRTPRALAGQVVRAGAPLRARRGARGARAGGGAGGRRTARAGTRLTLNLSLSSLGAPEIEAVLPERLEDFVIEVTENELAVGDPATAAAIAALRARGAALAVDDTGAGYAGLTHVMRLAPDVIKLDRALTTDIDSDPVKAALVSSFVRYARDIDATVCAEGIETAAELARLAELDVAFGQGFHIGRPSAPWIVVNPEPAAASRASFRAAFADDHVGSDLERLMRELALGAGRLAGGDGRGARRRRGAGARPARRAPPRCSSPIPATRPRRCAPPATAPSSCSRSAPAGTSWPTAAASVRGRASSSAAGASSRTSSRRRAAPR